MVARSVAIAVAALAVARRERFDRQARPRRRIARELALDLGRRPALEGERQAADQELGQQHSERPDVGRGGRQLAAQLLGRGALRRHRRRRCRVSSAGLVLLRAERLGDAEVEQPDVAFAGDEDVRRLQVAMDHEAAVRELDDAADGDEQPQRSSTPSWRSSAKRVIGRPSTYCSTRNGRPSARCRCRAGNDRRVAQPREDALLAPEARAASAPATRRTQKLDRHEVLVAGAGALGEIDLAHAAAAEEAADAVRSDRRPGRELCRSGRASNFSSSSSGRRFVAPSIASTSPASSASSAVRLAKPGFALLGRQGEGPSKSSAIASQRSGSEGVGHLLTPGDFAAGPDIRRDQARESAGHFLAQPGARRLPVALHGLRRHTEVVADLPHREAAEEVHLDDHGGARLHRAQARQRAVELQHLFRGAFGQERLHLLERNGDSPPPRFWRRRGAGVVHEHAPHRVRGDGEEVAAGCRVDVRLAEQAQVGLVHQRRRVEGMGGALAAQALPREPAELVVEQPDDPVEGPRLAAAHALQPTGDLAAEIVRRRRGAGLLAIHRCRGGGRRFTAAA